ncbi:MAG: peptidase S41 [Gemmatimonadetes bacterium]|uniref:Tricorn protease homolog n=1 Tax=Candidatus Kutchimonas denitrificans TaxID=3056748 RepID=A0AAE4Z927_9BACT|nr:peptidase S41 [Gemmatimonadota bacterium]NIR76074.1 peptidase S41 [Candidatus Kutchimonas denitrificans]NIS00453.1 peptidase S41 [Gemmatimonadota bacterium]NIT66111.1 peptidase S41 [Gemmatimonadota bacterium]NIU54189.1 peptidase S41 [Gemmatimonadota bacterium]
MRIATILGAALLVGFATTLEAQVDARMLRQPDVSDTQITFVYAGDIWVVAKTGGVAQRLSSPNGEESFPRFSPDGSTIAFSGNYDGNVDVYTIPALGGTPTRLTHNPMGDRTLEWHPDGERVLYASSMQSGRQRFSQFYYAPRQGGLPEKLPVPYGEFGAISPDGEWLAYMPKSRDFRTWKRYRGGWAPDIWLFNLEDYSSRNITNSDANESQPMWHGRTLYMLSDRSPNQRFNIWAYDLDSGDLRQVTQFEEFDIHFPAIGPSDIVFEAGGRLYLLDLATEEYSEVEIDVVTDLATLKPRSENVANLVTNARISPSGKRAVVEARGDLFTLPAEHGPVINLTASSGVAERSPAWSPDGRYVAYWSDRSGEYQLTLRAADGSGAEQQLTSFADGFRYRPYWSPDSKKIAFVDDGKTIWIYDLESRRATEVDQDMWMTHGGLNNFRVSWSADSRWLAYSRGLENRAGAVFLYDTDSGQLHQVTSGYYADFQPTFDPDGNYLFFLSNRTFRPAYGDVDNTWIYPNTTNIVAVSLRPDVPSPLAPRNDEESVDESADNGDEDEEGSDAVVIEPRDFEHRLVVLPPRAGNYTELQAVSGKVLYRRFPNTGSAEEDSPILFYDLEEREEKTVIGEADGFLVSADGKKMLVANDRRLAIVDVAPGQKMEKPLRTNELEATVDPRAEWRQIFADAWRFERDFFYDPNMHGVDWDAMRERYGRLIDDAVTRWDVNYVLGELIAELNASHTYRGGGDTESAERRGVGMLGVDWELDNGAYRIARIIDGAPWDSEVRSPFARPGVDVSAGDYVLAVNGVPIDVSKDPWAAFQGLGSSTVALTVNDRPDMQGAREVIVETLDTGDEIRLRHLAWIESNRSRVEEATDGRVGYIYVRSTGSDGQTELVRQFAAQFDKDGLIVDERFNSGGQIPDRFVELLNRPPLSFWAVRSGRDWPWPPVAHFGPKVMLINGWSGSGGDAFPYYFREYGVGPLIGSRTWGGLIGISGAPSLIDGGGVTVPTFRMYSTDGHWFAEGHGVEPDIPVPEDPTALARGTDPQLERAIQEVMRRLEMNPPVTADRPPYEDRTPQSADRRTNGNR